MQITLVQAEIETAIRQFVGNQVSIKDGMRLDIDLKATRGDVGYTCVVEIRNDNGENADAVAEREANLGIASKIEEARGDTPEQATEADDAQTDIEDILPEPDAVKADVQPETDVADEPAEEAAVVEEEPTSEETTDEGGDVAIDTATATANNEASAAPEEQAVTPNEEVAPAEEATVQAEAEEAPKPTEKKKSLFGNATPATPAVAA